MVILRIRRFPDDKHRFKFNVTYFLGWLLGVCFLLGAQFGFYQRNLDLFRADLSDQDLRNVYLFKANLIEAKLNGANLGEANLGEADLGKADLGKADLRGAKLVQANLWRANLGEANLGETDLRAANLTKAVLEGRIGEPDRALIREALHDLIAHANETPQGPYRGKQSPWTG